MSMDKTITRGNGWRSKISKTLFWVDPQINPLHFYGRVTLYLFLFIWGWRFIFMRVKPSKNLTLAGFVASLQNLTEVVSHLSFHVLLLAL